MSATSEDFYFFLEGQHHEQSTFFYSWKGRFKCFPSIKRSLRRIKLEHWLLHFSLARFISTFSSEIHSLSWRLTSYFFLFLIIFRIQVLLTGLRRHVFKKKWCRLHIFSHTCRYHSGALTIKSTYAATKPIGLRFASNTRTTARTSRFKGNHVHHLATTSAIHLTKMFLTACLRERWHSCHVFKRHIFQIFTDRIIFVQTKMFSDPPFKSSTHQEIWNLIGATLGQQKYENKQFGEKNSFKRLFSSFHQK